MNHERDPWNRSRHNPGDAAGHYELTDGQLAGRSATGPHLLQWDLRYAGSEAPVLLLPKAKALVALPNAMFHGVPVVV